MATALTMTRGDTPTFQVSITGLSASGLTGCALYFSAKRSHRDPDASAVFSKATGSGITVTQVGNATTPGIAQVTLAQSDTSGLAAYAALLYWDWVLVDTAGVHTTVASGTLFVSPDVYQAQ